MKLPGFAGILTQAVISPLAWRPLKLWSTFSTDIMSTRGAQQDTHRGVTIPVCRLPCTLGFRWTFFFEL